MTKPWCHPFELIEDINEVVDYYAFCRSPARARRRFDQRGIIGKVLLGVPSGSVVGRVVRIHPYFRSKLFKAIESYSPHSTDPKRHLYAAMRVVGIPLRRWKP